MVDGLAVLGYALRAARLLAPPKHRQNKRRRGRDGRGRGAHDNDAAEAPAGEGRPWGEVDPGLSVITHSRPDIVVTPDIATALPPVVAPAVPPPHDPVVGAAVSGGGDAAEPAAAGLPSTLGTQPTAGLIDSHPV